MNKKKIIIFAGVACVLAIILAVIVLVRKGNSPEVETTQEPEKRRLSEPVNVIPVMERAYVSILPIADGRHLDISINHLNKEAESVEYELEYQSGTMLQGAMGEMSLESLPAKEQIFLGSCSAGGACTYHTDISGGNLLLTFVGPENYALKTNWRYIDNSTRSSEVASWDAKFQLESKSLASIRYMIVFNSPGIPGGYEELSEEEFTIISDIYSFTTSSTVQGKGEVSIRLTEDAGSAKIVGFNGSKWVKFDTTVEDKVAKAEVDLMELYTVIR